MAGPTDMVGQLFIIASDKTQIEVGETVHFSISYDENRTPENDIDIYINNDFLESIPVTPSPISFNHRFEEEGVFLLYATTVGTPESNTIAINVDEATPQTQSNSVSWIINNKMVSSLEMNNKEIQSIVTSDNVVLYNIDSLGYDAISLSSDKNILSYADSESCTLSAQLLNGSTPASVNGVTVEFFNGDTSLGTATTNSSGVATKIYASTGSGDVSLTASADTFVSETYSIEDCLFYSHNDASKFDGMTQYDDYMGVYNDSYCTLKTPVPLPSDWEITMTMINTRSNSAWAIIYIGENDNAEVGIGKLARTTAGAYLSTEAVTESDSISSNVEYPMKITYQNGVLNLDYNNHNMDFIETITSFDYFLTIGLAGYNGNGTRVKDIKVKPLDISPNGILLTSDKSILSYSDNESCTLSAQLLDDDAPISISGVSVEFFNGSTSLGTADTNSSGIATLTYTSAGVGDMTLTASVDGIIVSETFSIRDFTYIADTMEKLATALTNVTTGNSIYLKDGTYSLPSSYTVSGIKLIGESTNAKIISSGGQINFTDSIVDTIGMETANVTRPVIYVDGTTTVKNCDCISNLKPWDATVISVNLNNPDGLITIHDCYFHGNAQSNGFGHSCSAITGQGSVAYNVIIHHNTFNHPCNSGQLHGSDKGKAVCFYNGGSRTGTLNNVHLYCNEYLGCGDTNITVSEEICPDN